MSYSPDTLKKIVKHGGNLILHNSYNPEILKELVSIAKSSGAHITIEGKYSPDIIASLVQVAGNNLTIIVREP
jgi:hypothetical protein